MSEPGAPSISPRSVFGAAAYRPQRDKSQKGHARVTGYGAYQLRFRCSSPPALRRCDSLGPRQQTTVLVTPVRQLEATVNFCESCSEAKSVQREPRKVCITR